MVWRVQSRQADHIWESPLAAYWEVQGDAISDNFDVTETSASELMGIWAEEVGAEYGDGLVPIHWYVEGKGQFEYMPFQYCHSSKPVVEDFLSYNAWPVSVATGEALNWLALPVVDKHWRAGSVRKGGFIQEATRWKPAILQPFAFLPALLHGVKPGN